MNNEYVIINKTELEAKIAETRIVALELDTVERHRRSKDWDWNHLVNNTKQELYKELLSKSTPLIPEIEKAFDAGRTVKNYKGEWKEAYHDDMTSAKYEESKDYITNLKLDI